MFQLIKSYLKFLYNSKNEHDVHSPFVFNFITKCLYDKKEYLGYNYLKLYQTLYLKDTIDTKKTIIDDNSHANKSYKSELTSTTKTAINRAKIIVRLASYFKPETILELGTSTELNTFALICGNENASITTLEKCPISLAVIKKVVPFSGFKSSKVHFLNTDFLNYRAELAKKNATFDLIFFNNNFLRKLDLDGIEFLISTTTNDSIWIFDTIYLTIESENKWKIIKAHPKITVTIDTFHFGIAFFRKEQQKQHFTIRI